ncbi:MAG: hypothetical protein FRX49_04269 [Trebouxia sp. A1-2]|nr:MAG: hypothetical protein FRX49_04269 [Trebouxia sp. A1-2]
MSKSADSTPQQKRAQLHSWPDISLLADELQKQWYDRLNMHLGNILIRPGSCRNVWWSCDKCPDGLPHIWQATILNRTYGTGCPFCSGRAVCQHNTLARKAPEVALFWDAKKNHPMSPDQRTVFSNTRAHWNCSACLHEWQATVVNKVHGKMGVQNLPKQMLAGKQMALGRSTLLLRWQSMPCSSNGIMTETARTEISLTTQHYEATSSFGGIAMHVPRASSGFSRTLPKKRTGCPCCAGYKLCDCNSLETVCPEVAADFDAGKNGVTAAEVTSSAGTKYSWLSDEPGAKKRSVKQRTTYTKQQVFTTARRS